MTRLVELAHARAGDKGNTSIIALIPFDPADFDRLCAAVTAVRVAEHFGVAEDAVSVRTTPALGSLTLVVRGRLDGGVTISRASDPHGKTLSGHLLALEVR